MSIYEVYTYRVYIHFYMYFVKIKLYTSRKTFVIYVLFQIPINVISLVKV